MSRFTPGQLQLWTGGVWHDSPQRPVRPVHGFSNDTRTLAPGDCFLALQTGKRDGHDFLADAARAGAVAALVSRVAADAPLPQLLVNDVPAALRRIAHQHRLRIHAPVVGVTGSAGKTSTKDLLAAMLGPAAFATQGNLNNTLGVPLMLLRVRPARHTAGAVIEAGMSEPGELECLGPVLRPDIAVITNVLPVHLAGMGTLDAVAQEKSAIARNVCPGGAIVLPASLLEFEAFGNLADSAGFCHSAASRSRVAARSLPCPRTAKYAVFPVVFPGDTDVSSPATHSGFLRAGFTEVPHGRRVCVLPPNGPLFIEFTMPECSDGMLRNATLAAVAARLAGSAPGTIRDAATHWHPSPGRGEIVLHGGRLFYVDCYNANPVSMLDAARAFDRRTSNHTAAPSGRLFALGGMNELGPDSVALHERTGRDLPLRAGDTLALFGGDSAALGTGAVAAGFPASAVRVAESIEVLREIIAAHSGPVFLKGSRSHALERALPPHP